MNLAMRSHVALGHDRGLFLRSGDAQYGTVVHRTFGDDVLRFNKTPPEELAVLIFRLS